MSENGGARSGPGFWQVLVGPGKAFAEMVAEPSFLKPGLILCGLNVLAGIVLIRKIQAVTAWLLTNNPAQLPPEQLEQTLAIAPKAAAVASVASAAAAPWVVWLVIAALLKLYAVFSTRETPFKTLFTVAVYGYLPVFLGGVVKTALLLSAPVENFYRVSLSLAAFSPAQGGFLYFFLSQCNPFTWWGLILWGIGGAAAMKTRPGGPIAYLFALWAAGALLTATLAAIKTPAGMM